MKVYLLTIILTATCSVFIINEVAFGETVFRVATYNVENLFDLKKNGSEYKEYIPNTRYRWNRETSKIKLNNISDVIKALNADIVLMQEIESREALLLLKSALKKKGLFYPFFAISDSGGAVVNCAVLSKYRIAEQREIKVTNSWRNILKLTVDIDGVQLIIYNNHWFSRHYPESKRLDAARRLMKDVDLLGSGSEYIIAGDLNSNYDEWQRINLDNRLNDSYGMTGINHVLKTVDTNKHVDKKMIQLAEYKGSLYNLWLEKNATERWSYIYSGRKSSLDHILISASLCDEKKIDYQVDSFNIYKPDSLFKNGKIYRWQKTGDGKHMGEGFSDHLPVYADFKIVN